MTDLIKFGQDESRERMSCEVCEAMCLDAVDGTLTPEEEAAFERHVAGCVMCADQLAEAKRGAAWMEMLKGHRPEPSAMLLSRILEQTSGAAGASVAASQAPAVAIAVPAAPRLAATPGKLLQFPRKFTNAFSFGGGATYFQPRLAMTAAMAFFSIALTMNLSGIRPGDLRPSSLHRTVADVSANAARSFQSLRVVNQVESRVSELRDDERHDDNRDPGGPFGGSSDTPKQAPVPTGPQSDKPAEKPAAPNGSSELVLPDAAKLQQISSGEPANTNTEAHTARKGA